MTTFTCPMDPDVIKDAPGNCPKCGMKLVLLISSEHEGHEDHASMEKEFRKRFFITLPFVLLTMLLSPNIQKWLYINLSFACQRSCVLGFSWNSSSNGRKGGFYCK